ncbi:hypothetical protein VPH35_122328 [Triticum aestivum]
MACAEVMASPGALAGSGGTRGQEACAPLSPSMAMSSPTTDMAPSKAVVAFLGGSAAGGGQGPTTASPARPAPTAGAAFISMSPRTGGGVAGQVVAGSPGPVVVGGPGDAAVSPASSPEHRASVSPDPVVGGSPVDRLRATAPRCSLAPVTTTRGAAVGGRAGGLSPSRASREEVIAFGGIPDPVSQGRRISVRLQEQPDVDDMQRRCALRAAKLPDVEISTGYLQGHGVHSYVVATHSDGGEGAFGYCVYPMGDGSSGYF